MSKVPRMRTMPECIEMLKELDPQTALTLTALRRKVKSGEFPSVQVGNRRLINFDMLVDLLNSNISTPAPSSSNKIRRLEERGGRV